MEIHITVYNDFEDAYECRVHNSNDAMTFIKFVDNFGSGVYRDPVKVDMNLVKECLDK